MTAHRAPFFQNIKLSSICCCLGLLFVYKIGSISYAIPGFGIVWYVAAALEIILALFAYSHGDAKIGGFHWCLLGYCMVVIFSTIYNHASLVACLNELVSLLPILIAVDLGMSGGSFRTLRFSARFAILLTSLNTLTAIIFPHAMFKDVTGAPTIFLLGADNSLIPLYMVSALLEMCSRTNKASERFPIPYYSLLNMLLFSILRDIATGKLISLLMIILLIVNRKTKKLRFSFAMAFGLNAAFFIVFVLGQSVIESFSFIFELLGRNSTFTSRSILWSFSLDLLAMNPFIGIGSFTADSFNRLIFMLTTSGLHNAGNPHNTYLTVLVTGGLLAFIFMLSIILTARANGGSCVRKSSPLYIFLFAFMLHAQVEGRDLAYVFFIALFIVHMNKSAGRFTRDEARGLVDVTPNPDGAELPIYSDMDTTGCQSPGEAMVRLN